MTRDAATRLRSTRIPSIVPPADTRRRPRYDRTTVAFSAAVVLTIAWGALSFGAVYPWAFTPLAVAATGLGLFGLTASSPRGRGVNWPLALAAGLFAAAVGVQLVPLSGPLRAVISPAADRLLRQLDVASAFTALAGVTPVHALTISPASTRRGLMLFASLAVFLVGLARTLDGRKTWLIVHGVIALGAGLALFGIVQRSIFNGFRGPIYGFWVVSPYALSFGPFVNRNHFAGWMLMAIPLAVACFNIVVRDSIER
jgi:hypothetical protein